MHRKRVESLQKDSLLYSFVSVTGVNGTLSWDGTLCRCVYIVHVHAARGEDT